MIKNCLNCNGEFELGVNNRIKFCSRKCYDDNKRIFWNENKGKIIELYKHGYGVHSIERLMEGKISHDFLHRLMKEEKITHDDSRSLGKVMVNLQPSEDLFYVLGVLHGDGWIVYGKHHQCKNSKMCRIALDCADKDFADAFYESCKKIGLNPSVWKHKRPKWTQGFCWRVQATSKVFVEWYKKLDYDYFLNANIEYKIPYIRGVFDSDGCNYKGMNVKITSVNREFLEMIKKNVDGFNFETKIRKIIWKTGYCHYDINIMGGKEERKRFLNLINPAIKRKRWINN
jgi:intein-encoded DNA endonuclease-like protein